MTGLIIGAVIGLIASVEIVRAHRAQPLFRTSHYPADQRGEGQVRGEHFNHIGVSTDV